MHLADSEHEVVRRHPLEQVARGAGLDDLLHVLVVVVHAQDEDLDRGVALLDVARRLEAVHARHDHVHEHDVGTQGLDLLEGLTSVAGLADDDDLALVGEQRAHALAKDRVVVNQQDADRSPVRDLCVCH